MEGGKYYRHDIGKRGEDLACTLLESLGHLILERNWRYSHLEIDVITLHADGIHFVEVKSRQKNIQAPPQENVNAVKQRRIVKAAQAFLRSEKGRKLGNKECMFDVIAITFEGDREDLVFIKDAFTPIYI